MRRTVSWSRVFPVAAVVWALLGFDHACAGGEAVTVDKVFQAWKERQRCVRTARFQMDVSQTHPKGSQLGSNDVAVMRGRASNPKAGPVPPHDTTVALKWSLSLNGDWMRFLNEGPRWEVKLDQFIPQKYISVYDGEESKRFFEKWGEGVHPLGFVNMEKHNPDITAFDLWPILLTYRALHPTMDLLFHDKPWVLAPGTGVFQERNCVILERQEGVRKYSCWVDPERDFTIRRVVETLNGNVGILLDIAYRNDPSHGWVPSSWDGRMLGTVTGQLQFSVSARVTDSEINVPIPREEFQFVFPPGTEVSDYRDQTHYVLLENGRKRLITHEERNRRATYEEWLVTETGMAGLAVQRPWWRGWPAWLLLALVVVATGWLARRRVLPGNQN